MNAVLSPVPANPLADFGDLSWAEAELLAASADGRIAQAPDLKASLENPDLWVRAEFLRFVAIEANPTHKVHERGVRLQHLRIVHDLDLTGCEVRRPLRFGDCQLEGVSLTGAKLSTLSFYGGTVDTLEGDRCQAVALFLRGVTVRNGARFLGAQVAGDIDCTGSTLLAAEPGAAREDPDFIGKNAALGLDGAAIGGAFFLRNARMRGSLVASSLAVGKVLDARSLVLVTGQVNLDSATLGGDVDFGRASVADMPDVGPSLFDWNMLLSQSRIAGTLRLSGRFVTDRGVNLNDARIAGNLSLRGGRFVADRPIAISAQRMQVEGTFDLDSTTCFGAEAARLADAATPSANGPLGPRPRDDAGAPDVAPGSALDLTAATVGSLSDQWAHWPRGNRVLGFRYKAIAGATSTRAGWWERWLKRQVDEDLGPVEDQKTVLGVDGFKPQPWDQAILALRAAGCLRDAEDLAIAKETAEHAFETGAMHALHRAWGTCAGYGYRPLRLLWALPFVYAFSVWMFWEAAEHGAMAPTKEELVAKADYQHCRPEYGGNWADCALAPAYPDFNAFGYALQTLLPAIELHQAKDWAPVQWQRPVVAMPAARAASATASGAARAQVVEPDRKPPASGWGRAALYWGWIEGTLGLVAPVLVGLALTGLIRRKLKD